MPQRRKQDKHLPARVYRKHSAYYYVDNENKWHRLGKTLPEAMIEWTRIVDFSDDYSSMESIFSRYMTEIAPTKSKISYENNLQQMKMLRRVFGHLKPEQITPVQIYQFLDLRGKTSRTSANREKELLSHVFTMAIRWGITKSNPCTVVKKLTVKKRNRYITDDEFVAVYQQANLFMQTIMKFAYLTGLRRGDIICIKNTDIKHQGIYIVTNKTGTKLLITWTNELRELVKQIQELPGYTMGETLFRTMKGTPCTARGISSIWQRLINKAMDLDLLNEKFTFHDIRRKSATDAEKLKGREYARQLLGHTDQRMTARYINNHQEVEPLKIRALFDKK